MTAIQLKTDVRGPRSRELNARRALLVPGGVADGVPVFVTRADGATVTDVDGNRPSTWPVALVL